MSFFFFLSLLPPILSLAQFSHHARTELWANQKKFFRSGTITLSVYFQFLRRQIDLHPFGVLFNAHRLCWKACKMGPLPSFLWGKPSCKPSSKVCVLFWPHELNADWFTSIWTRNVRRVKFPNLKISKKNFDFFYTVCGGCSHFPSLSHPLPPSNFSSFLTGFEDPKGLEVIQMRFFRFSNHFLVCFSLFLSPLPPSFPWPSSPTGMHAHMWAGPKKKI